jgi:hypothetical protein
MMATMTQRRVAGLRNPPEAGDERPGEEGIFPRKSSGNRNFIKNLHKKSAAGRNCGRAGNKAAHARTKAFLIQPNIRGCIEVSRGSKPASD